VIITGIATLVSNNSEDYPRILPAREDLVILPAGQEFILNQGVMAWPISGNPSSHKEFLCRLQPHLGDQKYSQTMTPCFRNDVLRGIEIPLRNL